ncbi:TPA: nucleotidyltransferase domain-containing protein [Candidatus Dependentiae bacterium]|nr:nucleotidyltransferase domain-containing protein [Candidatus Dependentiae bacterium]
MNERYKEILLKILTKEFPNAKVYLFGSQARGDVRVGSDIDLAIQEAKPVAIDRIWKALASIEETSVPYKIDLVDLENIPANLKSNILKEGILWKN